MSYRNAVKYILATRRSSQSLFLNFEKSIRFGSNVSKVTHANFYQNKGMF